MGFSASTQKLDIAKISTHQVLDSRVLSDSNCFCLLSLVGYSLSVVVQSVVLEANLLIIMRVNISGQFLRKLYDAL